MNVAQLLQELGEMAQAHGELPVFVVTGKYEFALRNVQHASEGPLPHLDGLESQLLPERIVLETSPKAADDVLSCDCY